MRRFFNLPARAKQIAQGASALALTAMVAPAFAGELASAVTEGIDKAELMLIGAAVLALAGVIALIRAGKKAAA